ncbi:hypothetical protein [Salinisphaera sp. G21_0]|uniref:hypothetical protein n=1 Tax=Salinisphaera sp. G21_0 TaxID=2821094 RepID=UPI001ADB92B0|nr:hypothetical protein [Salinisphaera sp. G21_0]MBO9484208.1 hypothetical protein [Salinisphaera sp. G21_0]
MQTIGSFSISSGSPNGCAYDQANGCQGNTDNVGDSSNNNRSKSDHNNQVAFCGFNVYGEQNKEKNKGHPKI